MKQRVLLDTNVWRYVIDTASQGLLFSLKRASHLEIQVAPGVVYETLRLKDPELRGRIIALMVDRRFTRLMPEAYSESLEILDAVNRLRPEWLRRTPDLDFIHRLKRDWSLKTGPGFWRRCAESADSEADWISSREGDSRVRGHEASQHASQEIKDAKWSRNPSFDKTMVRFSFDVPGWDGGEVHLWRADSLVGLTSYLATVGNAYRDWIAPFVEVDQGLLKSESWNRFWLYDVREAEVPRQWLRAAHSFAQRFRKVTRGSQGDTQLITYLAETDIFVTADKVLINIVEGCRAASPIKLPQCVLVPGGRDGLRQTLSDLRQAHASRRAS